MPLADIVVATRGYERWMASQTPVVRADLVYKHDLMAADLFVFLRATFYRWAMVWPEASPETADAPVVLAVGDLHVDNFGSWRDIEGRLVWGVNDFDEAHPLPYTIDLVRLATSALLAIDASHLSLTPKLACEALLSGYRQSLEAGGRPLVLAEEDRWLRRTAQAALPDPVRFWKRIDALPPVRSHVPDGVEEILEAALPDAVTYRLLRRRSGEGSLGRQRLVAEARWHGARLARQAKAALPSAWIWAHPLGDTGRDYHARTISAAVRCPDPHLTVTPDWIVRRLAPDCGRIELGMLPAKRDEYRLLHAMGWDTANVHLGSIKAVESIRADLARRPAEWLRSAARKMAGKTRSDWRAWRSDRGG